MIKSPSAKAPPGETDRWAAVLDRDARADGQFVYAVRTTGIYCRPSCGSRRPKRENVVFCDSPLGARAAGFRACLRCKPDEAEFGTGPRSGNEAVRRALAYIEGRAGEVPPLAELARASGLSPAHLQRNFSRLVGVSPRAYAQALRRERLKAGLRQGRAVSRAGWDAGYGSSRQLYEQGADALGMPPASYRAGGAGVTLRYTVAESVAGPLLLAATERGLCAAWFGQDDGALARELAGEFPSAELVRDDGALAPLATAVLRHLAEGAPLARIPLDIGGSPFGRLVWNQLRQIPYGETRTYGEVAAAIGRPGAARAVGTACAANPVALVIPCHRVVRADGTGGGYRWGEDRKRALLAREARGEMP
ncbi:MAG: bifunctional DNA-binding transcriptional regulator/O6-methylguanine-DNA methyltransferase Ada [Gemmatimonadales bacterium]|jgi:AraC family transcriptional regulator of adaptative response/methylated-DNA-[protein]-cysteine methyltransferase